MNNELKELIAMLLEDARRIQQLEPNAGTAARIVAAQKVLARGDDEYALPVLVATSYRLALAEAGYDYSVNIDDSLVVKDPIACSNGACKWVEHKDVVLRSNNDVTRFIESRN